MARDYERVASAIAYLVDHAVEQPDLARVAAHVGLSPHHMQRVFKRWAGISPKQFLGFVTQQRAGALLREQTPLLDTALDVGLSGPGRLHDLCLTWEAMTPGDIKGGGRRVRLAYGFHDSPFGRALLIAAPRGLSGLAFCDAGGEAAALRDLTSRWPHAVHERDEDRTGCYAETLFHGKRGDMRLLMRGTAFQIKVWEALLHIPPGRVVSYSAVAAHIGAPRAARAVGQAVGRNPVAYAVPCHRVLRSSGVLGGYRWGRTRKRAMLAYERGRRDLVS